MEITVENTPQIVYLKLGVIEFPARVWQDQSESGIPVQAFITGIAPEISKTDPRIDERAQGKNGAIKPWKSRRKPAALFWLAEISPAPRPNLTCRFSPSRPE